MVSKLNIGPKSPVWWQSIIWIFKPLDYLEECAQRYGNIFIIRLVGLKPIVIISDPQGIQEVFSSDAKFFDVGITNGIVIPLTGSNSLLVLDGDRHKQQRKLLMPPFHGESIKRYGELIVRITDKVASEWQEGKPFFARVEMQDITLEVILQAIFGLSEGERYQQLKPLVTEMLEMVASPWKATFLFWKFLQKEWGPWKKMVQSREKIYDILKEEINYRRAQPTVIGKDILSIMLSARDEQGQPMSDLELCDQMMTLLLAGHETTASVLAWAFYWIHKVPDVRDKLIQELETVQDHSDLMAINQLPYLNAVCQETLRMYPVVPITSPRLPKSRVEIMGYHFESDVFIAPCIYLIHHRQDLYPESKQFKPERFMERQFSPYEFLPFGGGNRHCLGYALAMLEIKLVLATVLSRYQLALAENKPVFPQRRGITIAPATNIKMRMLQKLTSRSSKAIAVI